MHSLQKGFIAGAVALVVTLALMVPSLTRASERDLRTEFSTDQPITVPGHVLEPNTKYVMMVGDSQTGTRQVVRIYNEDESELIAMFLTINDQRPEPADRTIFTFIETAEGYPQVVRSWFYPGRNTGMEFVYPKDQAMEIVQHSAEPVLATSDTGLEDLDAVEVVSIEPSEQGLTGQSASTFENENTTLAPPADVEQTAQLTPEEPLVTQNDQVPAIDEQQRAVDENANTPPAVTDQGDLKADSESVREKPVEQDNVPATQSSAAEQDTLNESELPATAGELPLLGLVGVLSLSLGFAVRLYARQ